MARTILAILGRIFLSTFITIAGKQTWNMSEAYFENVGPPNLELAKTVYPHAKTINQVFLIGRLIFVLACYKWPNLIKLAFYYEGLHSVI